MKSRFVLLIVLSLVVVTAGAVAAEDDAAAGHYLAGDKAWREGDLETAVFEWTEALKLKPTSSLTKDRLIEALFKKVEKLTQMLENPKSGQTDTIVIRSSGTSNGNSTSSSDPRILPPDKYTADAISEGLASSKVTTAQADAYWNRIQGWQVQWAGVIDNVKQTSISVYSVELLCGQKKVKVTATIKMSDAEAARLIKGKSVVCTGILDSREKRGSSCSFKLSNAQIQ